MSRNTKSVIVIILCVAVLGLSIGYAALNSILNITGTAKLGPTASSWNIRFENAKCEASGYATAGTITTEGTNLELSESILKAPSDAVTCTFDVVNKGTLDAKVISVTEPNKNNFTYIGTAEDDWNAQYDEKLVRRGLSSEMKYNDAEKTAIKVGDTLNVGETKKIYIKINYIDELKELPYDEVEISDIFAQIIYGQAAVGEKETTKEDFPELLGCSTVGNEAVSYSPGTRYVCDPGDGKRRQFYVLEENGDNVSLIMARNIGGTVAWVAKEDYLAAGGSEAEWNTPYTNAGNNSKGPITIRNYLNKVTSDWNDVIVSLPTYDQIYNVSGSTSLSNWLYGGLACYVDECTESVPNDTANNGSIRGYWTASPIAGFSCIAWDVFGFGELRNDDVGYSVNAGLRPVITLSKSKLSQGNNNWTNVVGNTMEER